MMATNSCSFFMSTINGKSLPQVILHIKAILDQIAREIKHRFYDKRQTWICTSWPSFSFTCRLTVYYNFTKIGRFRPILSIRNYYCLKLFLSAHFSTWIWHLPFAINAMLNLSNVDSICTVYTYTPTGHRKLSKLKWNHKSQASDFTVWKVAIMRLKKWDILPKTL